MASLDSFRAPSPERWVSELGISREAAELTAHSDVIDLHVESFSFYRSFGYDLYKRHAPGLNRALLFGQADIPRLMEAGVTGATWAITANPLRPQEDRAASFEFLLETLKSILNGADGRVAVVRNHGEYQAARARGQHAAWIGVQGANALPADLSALASWSRDLLRITLLHLTSSGWGRTSAPSPWPGDPGLSRRGHELVERLNELRIGIDLAHIHPRGFWDALATSHPSVPVLVTHTGVSGVHPHWRNLDDRQCRAIADRGGTIGIMYHAEFLGDPLFGGRLATVVRHVLHLLEIVGENHVSLGSDWDGAICTPRDMPTCLELPKLVDALLAESVAPDVVQKVLGANFLRVVRELKGS